MGLGIPRFGRGCTQTGPSYEEMPKRAPVDPDPKRFELVMMKRIGQAAVAMIRYLDCTNYEGRKVLIYADADDFMREASAADLDPHFRPGSGPLARFEPTDRGWELAVKFACELSMDEGREGRDG